MQHSVGNISIINLKKQEKNKIFTKKLEKTFDDNWNNE